MTVDTQRFSWLSYDLRSTLPDDWQQSITTFAVAKVRNKMICPNSVTSRENSQDVEITTQFVDGATIAAGFPWLYGLYAGLFRDLAQTFSNEPVSVAGDPRHGMLLHVRRGTEARYECHVDSAPLTGLFYITDHPVGRGGELVVANSKNAWGPEEVAADATRIHPVAGQLLFFDARNNTHYIEPLTDPDDLRLSIAMTFFTVSNPEGTRPVDLDAHLGLL